MLFPTLISTCRKRSANILFSHVKTPPSLSATAVSPSLALVTEHGAVPAMRVGSCFDLPPLKPKRGLSLEHLQATEELVRPPTGGMHWWVNYRSFGLSTPRVAAAIARAAGCDDSDIQSPGPRPRSATVTGWMSLPKELCDNPKQIMGAGYKRQVRILAVKEGKRPLVPAEIKGFEWRLQIPGAGDYRLIRALIERLRKVGGANYFGPAITGPGDAWARWGKSVASGKGLPAAAREVGIEARTALRAYRADCVNAMIAARVGDGSLGTVLPGDVVRTHIQQSPAKQGLEVVDADDAAALAAWQARSDSREVQAQVPVPGTWHADHDGPTAATAAAGDGFAAVLADRELRRLEEFPAEWRDLRFWPTGLKGDIERGDAVIQCRLPVWVHIESLLAELLQREAGE